MPVNSSSNEYVGTAGDDVLVNRPRPAGNVTLVSQDEDGLQYSADRSHPVFLASGTEVAFENNGLWLVKDLLTGVLRPAEVGEEGSSLYIDDYDPVVSPDGIHIAYIIVDGYETSDGFYIQHNVYLKNLLTDETLLVSQGNLGEPGNGLSFKPTFSPDGTKLAYWSSADNLVDGDLNGAMDIFIKDLTTQAVTRIRVAEIGPYAASNVGQIAFSPDGTKITFRAESDILVAGDQNYGIEVFVVDINSAVVGVDVFYGGDGVDTVSYRNAASGVTIYLPNTNYSEVTGEAKGDQYFSIERFQLSSHNDVFVGASIEGAHNWASGGAGDDIFEAGGYLTGVDTTNTFYGGIGDDYFVGLNGETTAYGGLDNDTYWAESGTIGIDEFYGGAGLDYFHGEGGNDKAYGGADDDILDGMNGDDYLHGGAGEDVLTGGAGNDTLHGGGGDDQLFGDDGDDFIAGEQGLDVIIGGFGNDVIRGGGDADYLSGDDGDDRVSGGEGADEITGGEGNDVLTGSHGADTIYGNAGDDLLLGGFDNDLLYGNEGADRVLGGAGDDEIDGGEGDDALIGGEGNDTINGGSGNNALHGGNGDDNLFGDEGDDKLVGDDGNDILNGSFGNNNLDGGAGNDIFFSHYGNNVMRGGSGADSFEFSGGETSASTIVDFELGVDVMTFSQTQPTDLTLTLVGGDTLISIATSGATIRVRGVTDMAALEQDMLFF
jgi:Ca2+-binding RTX toxin-like protein